MDLQILWLYIGAASISSIVFSILRYSKTNSWSWFSRRRFPGPTQLPLIGRVHDLPRTSTWLKFKEWADKYGPIYETSMMGQKFIIVTDEDMANDIMVKNGGSFSGRLQIRALINHKTAPTYLALQDRTGTFVNGGRMLNTYLKY